MSKRHRSKKYGRKLFIILAFIEVLLILYIWALSGYNKSVSRIFIAVILFIVIQLTSKIVYYIWAFWGYSKSDYNIVTHKSAFSVLTDKGASGEYQIYRHLKKYDGPQKWLFNVYLPRENGRTTEIDVLLIRPTGIFVFESKNYSGWIFGTETRKTWTQCLKPSEHSKTIKNRFLNPIMQNKLHLRWLKVALEGMDTIPTHSVIVFGNRCKLKNIILTSGKHTVINRKQIVTTVNGIKDNLLTEEQMNAVYDRLYKYTQVDETVKAAHIQAIMAEINEQTDGDMTVEAAEQPLPSAVAQAAQPDSITAAAPIETITSTEQEKISEPSQSDEAPVCPLCGNKLILRTAKKGQDAGNQFWGCSGFPNCRYSRHI